MRHNNHRLALSTIMMRCPNCGAELNVSRFHLSCDYCGTVIKDSVESTEHPLILSQGVVHKHYEYAKRNIVRISKSKFVRVESDASWLYIQSRYSFYGNNGMMQRICNPGFVLQWCSNNNVEKIQLGVVSDYPASRLSLRLDNNIIPLTLQSKENRVSWFKIQYETLFSICQSKVVDIDIDIKTDHRTRYNEFPIFVSRFYNLVFDYTKFSYSLDIRLISDD